MKCKYLLIALVIISVKSYNQPLYDWVVIGAGPAGIATIGLLLDSGVAKETLLWIDPAFQVGRLGAYYTSVPGNSKAQTYQFYVTQCSLFKEVNTDSINKLMHYDPLTEPVLGAVIQPLQDITTHILNTIPHTVDTVTGLQCIQDIWHIELIHHTLCASNVILATGCHPHVLSYPGPQPIDLDLALDKAKLAQQVGPHDTVAVVGSAHSATLILMYLNEMGIKTVHLYKHPFQYKYDMGEGNPTTITGLQGIAAQWAYHVYEKELPSTITRVYNTEENRNHWLQKCTKIIYAVGYVRNCIPGWDFDTLVYDSQTGVIEPHLFGIGLAFPEEVYDYNGTKNYAIGLIDFMKYGQRVVPQWVNQHAARSSREGLKESFIVTQL